MFRFALASFRSRITERAFARTAQGVFLLLAATSVACVYFLPSIVVGSKNNPLGEIIKFFACLLFQFLVSAAILKSLDDYLVKDLNSKLVSAWTIGTGVPWVLISLGAWITPSLYIGIVFNLIGCLLLVIGIELGIRRQRNIQNWKRVKNWITMGNYWIDLVFTHMRIALFELGLISGSTASQNLLDRIFSEFCIGE